MRLSQDFYLRDVCGENVIVAEGRRNIDFTQIVSLNESGALLWNEAKKGDFTIDSLTDVLCAEYDIDRETAHTDTEAIVSRWVELGMTE
ncbi:MAG: PqqD family protein [Bacteroidaceae bacterium]|nr:PqqD family protein [Bacteroidaceae bacterium]